MAMEPIQTRAYHLMPSLTFNIDDLVGEIFGPQYKHSSYHILIYWSKFLHYKLDMHHTLHLATTQISKHKKIINCPQQYNLQVEMLLEAS